MSERIRQLEDALAIFQASVSNERHPLLRDELLGIKYGPEVRHTVDEEAARNKLATSVDALGTLTVGEHGETKFIGRSGGSETVGQQLNDSSDSSDEHELEVVELDDDFENMSITFPLTIVQDGTDEILHRLEGELPPRERAWALCEAYLAHFSWSFRPIKRDELVNEILSPIYKTVGDFNNNGGYHPKSGCGGRCPHLLAVLFNILAIGALVDLTLQPCNGEAEKYYRLGRASLSLRSILDSPEFETWKLAFTASLILKAHDVILAAEAPDYEKILDIDRMIRQLSMPKAKLYPRPDDEEYYDAALCMQNCYMSQLRSVAMMATHRTFFAQALLDHPTNPLKSPYAPSFLAANRCASVWIKSFLHHCERFPSLCGRFWTLWTHAFTACVILGATVARCPGATMAPTSLIELDLAVDLFKKGSGYSRRARQALPMLNTLRARATVSYQQFRNQHISPALNVHLHIGPEGNAADGLAIFGGQTRVMSSKLLSRHPPKVKKSRTDSPRPSSSDMSWDSALSEDAPTSSSESAGGTPPQNIREAFNDVHPALVNYLSLYPSSVALVDMTTPLADSPMSFSSSDMSAFAAPFPQAGPSAPPTFSRSFMTDTVFSHVPQPLSMSPTNVHVQQNSTIGSHADSGFAQVVGENGVVDTNGRFSGFSGVPTANMAGYAENMPLEDHAVLNEQWMYLMRDMGLLASGDVYAAGNEQQNGVHIPGVTEGTSMLY
ncbi:hypothetical protein EUX98_g33 [Antrodiella citrinella]|uniref:Transcription factor domain-containing protein n=1 Tax=Antrodiella citrinella TaxID=2447956 RepID=A0A4S4N4Z1_9APHY|nr:hypothetical protein EUX98_g33 [Antrodiella citrinella]